MAKVVKETIMGDLLKTNPEVVPVLLNAGMHCIGCPSSIGESLEEDLVNEIFSKFCMGK
jgi:hybrid cluster-associated redox disulfide protein